MASTLSSQIPRTAQSAEIVYVVLQHSASAGNSALLPVSSIKGVFRTRQEARIHLQRWKDEQLPLIRDLGGPGLPMFWNTSSDADTEGDGVKFTAANGEEFVLWIEEHEVTDSRKVRASV